MTSVETQGRFAARRAVFVAAFAVLALPLTSRGQDPKPGRKGVLPDAEFAQKVRATRATHDAGDYYLYEGRRVALRRSSDIAVRFAPAVTGEGAERIARELDPAASIDSPQRRGTRGVSIVHFPDRLADGAKPDDEGAAAKRLMERTRALNARSDVSWALPVFVNPRTGNRLALTDEVIVRLAPKATVEKLAARYEIEMAKRLWGTSDEYVLRVLDPRKTDPLAVANAIGEGGLVLWAQPNFVQEYRKSAAPNDPSFPSQWHLNNTGQGGGTADADPDLPEAWDLSSGSSDIVIAVIDDGVEMTHEDLSANIFSNNLEIAGNGVDDDGNGYTDDVNGWDFSNADNDPSPMDADDNHGTAVAGVAAGRGNNAVGISGACQSCRILPVKIFTPDFVGDSEAADAIRYAASLADVLNNSWGGGSPSTAIHSAIQWATTSGRGGKGSVVLFASGNYASGYYTFRLTGVPAGTHRFRWIYSKDNVDIDPVGADTAWLGWVEFPGGERANFEAGMPAGFTSAGSAVWSVVSDRAHADEGWCFTHAAKAGTITHSQTSYLDAVKTVSAGALRYTAWVESESDGTYIYDYLRLEVDLNNDGSWLGPFFYQGGIPYVSTAVAYPAAYGEAVAVGASSDFDCPACYSEYGPELDLVAPSSGGSSQITTTDRMGALGYDAASNYTATFGGTSSATPLTSGIVGLMLSQNPALTQAQVVQILHDSADKVGPDPYAGGRNDRLGYGRVNAYQALLQSLPDPPTITSFTPTSGPVGTPVGITGTNLAGTSAVAFNGASAGYTVDSATSITATVPAGATTGPISVTTAAGTATSAGIFTVTASLPPTITSFTPTSGPVGTSIAITGTNFTGATAVAFNGTSAGYIVNSATSITATVPPAATTGPISVTSPGGTATSASSFTVIPIPTITSFTPTSGPVGTSVAITGTDFTGATAVAFNGTSAGYAVNSATSITATVPAGATTGPISVTAPGGTGTSAGSFTVTTAGFMDIAAGLPGVRYASVAWGDYDNDGDLDILLTGDTGSGYISRVYRNDGSGVFTDIAAGLPGVYYVLAPWGDYDNDGDLDILLTGDTGSGYISRVYRNDGSGVFTDIAAGLTGARTGMAAWGDYDNDGDLDILLTGYITSGASRISRVYRNDGSGVFTDIGAGLLGVGVSAVAWGDYDGDGDLDILLTGSSDSGTISKVYRNDAGVFTDIGAGLTGVYNSSAAWGDYDNDGDLDILLSGYSTSGYVSQVYRNDAGAFTDIGAGLTGVGYGSGVWGDFDNDGDLDILLTGRLSSGSGISRVYRNDGGVFTDIAAGLTGVGYYGSSAWGDYDNDGDLDILLAGDTGSGYVTRVYQSNGAVANVVPSAPGNLSATDDGGSVTLGWSASSDAQTPATGLTYNVRVGTTSGTVDALAPMADADGYRHIPALGNAQHGTTATLKSLPAGTYYWSVQAVDTAFAGSAFSDEGTFTVQPPSVTGFTPTSGPVGTFVNIVGARLAGATAVSFNGLSAGSFWVNSATSITARVPSGATTGPVSVTTAAGTGTSAGDFTVTSSSPPTITSFVPTSGPVGTTVGITGANLAGATAVAFNGTSASFTVHSTSLIVATAPSGATTGPISVTTPGGTATSAGSFTVTSSPPPTLLYLCNTPSALCTSPETGGTSRQSTFSSGLSATWTGTNILSGDISGTSYTFHLYAASSGTTSFRADLRINGSIVATTTFSASSTTYTLKASTVTGIDPTLTGTSTVTLQVTNTGGSNGGILYGDFGVDDSYVSLPSGPPVPRVTGFTPWGGTAGAAVSITGANFTGATAVAFNGVSAGYSVNSATSITATVPAGATSGPISVTTPYGLAASATNFIVIPMPTIASFTPTGGGFGTSVAINGTNFTGATAVAFNGTSAAYTVDSATSITATVPVAATTGPISVTTPYGTAASASSFTVVPPPTITSYTPSSGPAGTTVAVTGTNFTGATAVAFNGTSASYTVNSATSITATVPSGATTGPISVTTPGGTALSAGSFTVIPTCTFSLAPTSASVPPTAGSQVVTITMGPAGCAGEEWTTAGNGSWITVSPAGGTGPGSATVSWDANPGFARSGDATIAGQTFTVMQDSPSTDYFTVTPCRLLDTRLTNVLTFGTAETFQVAGECGVSASATAAALNVTVVGATANGNCRLYPDPSEIPTVSTINFVTGLTRANNAVVSLLTPPGTVTVRCVGAGAGTVHLVLDVFGYFDVTGATSLP